MADAGGAVAHVRDHLVEALDLGGGERARDLGHAHVRADEGLAGGVLADVAGGGGELAALVVEAGGAVEDAELVRDEGAAFAGGDVLGVWRLKAPASPMLPTWRPW